MVRLYRLGHDRYVQHTEGRPLPAELESYARERRGEMPPYMVLPQGPVTFRVSEEGCRPRTFAWNGRDPLPPVVLQYVCQQGALPPQDP